MLQLKLFSFGVAKLSREQLLNQQDYVKEETKALVNLKEGFYKVDCTKMINDESYLFTFEKKDDEVTVNISRCCVTKWIFYG